MEKVTSGDSQTLFVPLGADTAQRASMELCHREFCHRSTVRTKRKSPQGMPKLEPKWLRMRLSLCLWRVSLGWLSSLIWRLLLFGLKNCWMHGDCTPLRQLSLCVLPVLYRLRASFRLAHLKDLVQGWAPQSVVSRRNGLSSVEVQSGAGG